MPALDGLRCLAIVAVLAFHSGYRSARGGFLGVSLFFTISGYLITTLLIDEHDRHGRIDLARFWERRFRRLAPAAIVTLAVITIAAGKVADLSQRAALKGDVLSALGYVANWRFLAQGHSYADLFRSPSPVLHFWSLAIEEQFYLVFPIIVAVVMSRTRSPHRALLAALIALGVGSVAMQLTATNFDRVYYGTDTRLLELVAGAVLATLTYRRRKVFEKFHLGAAALGVVAVATFAGLVATAQIGAAWLMHGGLVLVALVNVALIVSVLTPGPLSRVFAFRPFVAIGAVSYGLYLVHWPVFVWLDEQRTGLTGVALLAVRLAVVVPLTLVSYHLLECPVRFSRRLPTRRRFATAFAFGLTAAIVVILAIPSVAVPSLIDTRVLAVALSHQKARPAPKRVMLVGDSTGTAVARGLAAAHDPRMIVDDATRPGCGILETGYARHFLGDPERDTAGCADEARRWLARAKAFRPDLIVVVSSFEDAGDHAAFRDGLWFDVALLALYRRTISDYRVAAQTLRSTGAVVAWANIPKYTFAAHPEVRADQHFDERVGLLNEVITEITASELGVVPLDLASHLDRPDGSIDQRVRPDGIHLSRGAATSAADDWLDNALLGAYSDAEREIGVDARTSTAVRVLVTGDSTSLAIAAGLGYHGRVHGDVVVDWAGQIACPLLHADAIRNLVDDSAAPLASCQSFPTLWAQHLTSFRPDVVLIVSSLIDASDLDFANGWEHIGEPAYDDRYRIGMQAAIDQFHRHGAIVLWASAPREQLSTSNATTELNARLSALNAIITSMTTARARVQEVPYAARIDRTDGHVDLTDRPDGVHFTVPAATRVADDWLAAAVVAAKHEK